MFQNFFNPILKHNYVKTIKNFYIVTKIYKFGKHEEIVQSTVINEYCKHWKVDWITILLEFD